MRVTNEQIRAEIICTQRESCDGCPFYGVDNCDNLRGNDFDMYKDILEDRALIDKQKEIIKEMREYINGLPNEVTDGTKAISILEKSKDYA